MTDILDLEHERGWPSGARRHGGALFVEAHPACELVDLPARDLLELAARCVLGRQVAAQHAQLVLQPEG